MDADILQQVCEKYGLNYDTVTLRGSQQRHLTMVCTECKSTEGEKTMPELGYVLGALLLCGTGIFFIYNNAKEYTKPSEITLRMNYGHLTSIQGYAQYLSRKAE